MGFWTAIVAIVALALMTDIVKKAIKNKRNATADEEAVAAKDARILELEQAVTRLSAENESLKVALEEQRILADEAVSTFGSRLERLKQGGSNRRTDGEVEVPES